MNSFFLDIWHDLRAKRLWPFAVLLAVAIAAVPFALVKKEEPAPAPATVSPNTSGPSAATTLPTVALEDTSTATVPSKLESFKQKNPFRPLKDLPKEAGDDQNKTVTVSSSDDSKASSGSGSGSGGSGSGSGGSSGDTGSGAGTAVGPQVTYYTYRADISFGEPGKEKKYENVEKFTLLGGDKTNPAAMYLGVSDDADQIAFAVDTSLYEASGEDECQPAEDNCEVLYLSVDDDKNEATISSLDGTTSFNVKLLKIERVVLSKEDVESTPLADEDDTSAGKTGKAQRSDKAELDTAEPLVDSLFDVLAKRTR